MEKSRIKVIGHEGHRPYVGHFQGNAVKKYIDIFEGLIENKVIISPRISVITVFTDKEKAVGAIQLEASNQAYVNAYKEENKPWSNPDKIKYYIEELEKTTTEYALLMDGYDVVFIKNIDDEFIKAFEGMNKRIIFNATKNNYPKITLNDEYSNNEFKYLNAGLAFGYTKDLLSFYKKAYELTKDLRIMNPWNSEQLYIRLAAKNNENVGIDSECRLFQTFSKTTKTQLGNNIIII